MAQEKGSPPTVAIDGYNLKVVENFTYLGSTISSSLSIDVEINGRIAKAVAVMARLNQRVWSNNNLTVKTKLCVYKACVLSTLLYSSETWTTEILLVGPKNSTQNLLDYNLQLDGCTVTSSTVKNLGVILDSNLSFENHISNVTKTAFFHLRNISKLRNMLSVSDAEKLVHAFMTSRLDYCNALLGGCPASSINKLQIVQNAAARVLTRSRKYDHITPILQSLHWLPIKFRISYKILLLAYKALNDLAPAYLTNLLSRYNPTRSLRSQNSGLLVVPRIAKSTKGGRTFSYLAPKLWNSLPENVRGSDTLSLFKSRLKTHLFSQAFI